MLFCACIYISYFCTSWEVWNLTTAYQSIDGLGTWLPPSCRSQTQMWIDYITSGNENTLGMVLTKKQLKFTDLLNHDMVILWCSGNDDGDKPYMKLKGH